MDKMKQGKKDSQLTNYETNEAEELFFKAFSKPTQIYRYLRTRHSISPVFMHRTLSYMKHRMSRDNSKRSTFKVDSILGMVQTKLAELNSIENENNSKFSNLSINFTNLVGGYKLTEDKPIVSVELYLLTNIKTDPKIKEKKIGECKLNLGENSLNSNSNSNHLNVSKDNFKPGAKNFLIFNVKITKNKPTSQLNGDHELKEDLNHSHSNHNQNKKRKTYQETKYYRAELNVFDSNQDVLKDGEYSVFLTEKIEPIDHLNGDKQDNLKDNLTKVYWSSAIQLPNDTQFNNISQFNNQIEYLVFNLNWKNDLNNDQNSTKNHQHPLKQIDPPNTTGHQTNKTSTTHSSTKNSKRYQIAYSNGYTNGNLSNGLCSHNNILSNGNRNSSITNGNHNNEQNSSPKVIYRFIFNNQILQHTKSSNDYRCPWCALNCIQIYSLKHHLKFYHSRFNFKFGLDIKGYKIDVTINESYDGSYCLNKQLDVANFNIIANRPNQRTPVTHLLVNLRGKSRQKLLSEYLDCEVIEFDIFRTQKIGHDRLYYHSRTLQPIKPQEMDIDSEDEMDPDWMQKKTQLLIDEFTDVNEGEKEVMKLWNLHMMKYHNFLGNCHVPLACDKFVIDNWREIIKRNIYYNFVLHLINLFDYRLLTSTDLRAIIKQFNDIKNAEISEEDDKSDSI